MYIKQLQTIAMIVFFVCQSVCNCFAKKEKKFLKSSTSNYRLFSMIPFLGKPDDQMIVTPDPPMKAEMYQNSFKMPIKSICMQNKYILT